MKNTKTPKKRLYQLPGSSCENQHFATVLFDEEVYRICYTSLSDSEGMRITAIIQTAGKRAKKDAVRIYRAEEPKLWNDIRATLLGGEELKFDDSV